MARSRSRAFGLGSGRALAALAAAGLTVAAAACGTSHTSYSSSGFQPSYPSYLPAKSLQIGTDGVLTGTMAKPALTVEGDTVVVKTPHWSVHIEVSGPVVPGEGLPYVAPSTTCTWTVRMSDASGEIPISLADFNSIDHLGNVYHLHFVPGQPTPPATLTSGHTTTFEVRSFEATGEGLMRWAPIDQKIVAMWDYEVEND